MNGAFESGMELYFDEGLCHDMRDANYVRDLQSTMEGELKPLEDLKLPSRSQAGKFIDEETRNGRFTFDSITAAPAGMYLFAKFARGHDEVSEPRMKFLEATIRFRQTESRWRRAETARQLWNSFLRGDTPELAAVEEHGAKSLDSSYVLKEGTHSASAIFAATVHGVTQSSKAWASPVSEDFEELSAEAQGAIDDACRSASVYVRENDGADATTGDPFKSSSVMIGGGARRDAAGGNVGGLAMSSSVLIEKRSQQDSKSGFRFGRQVLPPNKTETQ